MEIDWLVVAIEALNFGVLVALLRRFLFRPVAATLDTRRNEIESARLHNEERENASVRIRDEYLARTTALEEEARTQMEAAVAEGQTRAGALVDAGRAEAQRLVDVADADCKLARQHALAGLRLEVFAIAKEAAKRVVHHMGADSITLAYARRGAHTLKTILDADPEPASQPVELAVAPDTDPGGIAAGLAEILGPDVQFDVTTDPGIVGGVRLSIGSYEIEASASASLEQWYAERVGPSDHVEGQA